LAGQTNSDRIRELERETAALVARADSLQRDVERVEKRLDDLSGRRWDIWKIIITAVAAIITGVAGFFIRGAIDRQMSLEPASRPPTSSDRN
jgi:hypothetical protein